MLPTPLCATSPPAPEDLGLQAAAEEAGDVGGGPGRGGVGRSPQEGVQGSSEQLGSLVRPEELGLDLGGQPQGDGPLVDASSLGHLQGAEAAGGHGLPQAAGENTQRDRVFGLGLG